MAEAARDLDLSENVLCRWTRELTATLLRPFPRTGQMHNPVLKVTDGAMRAAEAAITVLLVHLGALAMRLNFLSLHKKFSMRCRRLQISVSI